MDSADHLHTQPRAIAREQRAVGLAIAFALLISILTLSIAFFADRSTAALPFADRLQQTVRLELFVIAWLVATVGNVARLRFFSEIDIGGGNSEQESHKVRQARSILQNTLEQVVLAMTTHIIFAATFDRSTWFITALAGLFVLGRLLFWAGYKHGGAGRALGFGLTFYPTVFALLASGAAIFAG